MHVTFIDPCNLSVQFKNTQDVPNAVTQFSSQQSWQSPSSFSAMITTTLCIFRHTLVVWLLMVTMLPSLYAGSKVIGKGSKILITLSTITPTLSTTGVIYDNNVVGANATTSGVNAITASSLTVPIGDNVVVIALVRSTLSTDVQSVSFAGQSMTKFQNRIGATGPRGEFWYRVMGNVTSAVSGDIVVTYAATTSTYKAVAVASFHNVNQITPLSSLTGVAYTSPFTSSSLAVAGNVADMVVEEISAYTGTTSFTALSGQSLMGTFADPTGLKLTTAIKEQTGGSTTLSWRASGVNSTAAGIHMAANIKAVPEIDVISNNNSIANNDFSPQVADNTDFGEASAGSQSVSQAFSITSIGIGALTLSGTPSVSIIGANAADFTVTTQPTSPIQIGTASNFTIAFAPSAAGLRSATVVIANDDTDESTYRFAIQGTGVCSSTVSISANPSLTVTSGNNVTLTASGADSYTWSNGLSGSTIIVSNVTSATTLSVTGTTGACSSTAEASILVVAPPQSPTLIASASVVCTGTPLSVTALCDSGTASFTANPSAGSASGNVFTFGGATPTGVYSLSATCVNTGISSTATALAASLTINQAPNVSITPSATTISSGGSATLTASGASTYSWNTTPASSNTTINVSPTQTTIYSVTGTSNGCTGTASATVTQECGEPVQARATSVTQTAILGPGNCSVSLRGTGYGTGYTITGPNGYVFSAVYRNVGSYSINALSVTQPGTYILKVSYSNACGNTSSDTITYIVTGTACH